MHFSNLALASLVLLSPLITAHGGGVAGAPRVFGRRSALEAEREHIKERSATYQGHLAEHLQHVHHVPQTVSSNTQGQCGSGFGSCAAGYCCSEAGWCGQGTDYCAAPGCQYDYGPACDDHTVPHGSNTSTVARPENGTVPYGGAGIYDCTVPGTVALTYDDGPYIYTNDVLDVLKQYNAKATFFMTGNNNGKGEIDNAANGWSTIVQRAYNEGHQLASHTWTHPHLSNLTSQQRKQNMWSNEMALRNILGFFPTYMRPPYSDCTAESGCQDDMAELGYHITYFDVDTEDYDNDSPSKIQNAKNNFNAGIAGGSASTSDYLVISHDIHEQTAHNLTAYMLQTLLAQGYKPVTVGECLGDPEENWYRSSPGSLFTSSTTVAATATTTSAMVVSATAASTDATCGGSTGFTCANSAFGNCCSAAGWCGSGETYCGEGCQTGFGNCGINVSPNSATTATTSTAAAAAAAMATGESEDASCGGKTGYTCQGSVFGECYSKNGFCGSTEAYCGSGCQSAFGTCTGSASVGTSAAAK